MDKSENMAEVKTSDQAVFHIKKEQLPLHCPLPEMSLWNQHPRRSMISNRARSAAWPVSQ